MLNYSGRAEIINAVNACKNNIKGIITDKDFENYLLTNKQPPIDIMLRTGGDTRLSDFLLYQLAYSELFFINKKFPELIIEDVINIFDEYNNRKRNFGS